MKKITVSVLLCVFLWSIFVGCSDDDVKKQEMILVEAGTTSAANGSVTVENDFYIGKYYVTQTEFEEVMGFNPSYFNAQDHPDLTGNTANRPVEQVSWYDAIMFCNKLSEREGLGNYYTISDIKYDGNNIIDAGVIKNDLASGYRLPTPEEWEYAARGGKDGEATRYAGSDNINEVSWFIRNSMAANSSKEYNRGTMPVGEKEPNELGLYDMSGNVIDWTNSIVDSKCILWGGSYTGPAVFHVIELEPSARYSHVGFRPVRIR